MPLDAPVMSANWLPSEFVDVAMCLPERQMQETAELLGWDFFWATRSGRGAQIFYPAEHPGVVRTAPENLFAGRALTELVLRRAGVRGQQFLHFFFQHRNKPSIAVHAARERMKMRPQSEALAQLAQLIVRLVS